MGSLTLETLENVMEQPTRTRLRWRSWPAALALATTALVLAACGGGGSGGTVEDNPARQTLSSGRISGFGSVIVNGVRFDDSAARVSDDDGAGRDRSTLKLGMVVDVRSGEVHRTSTSASATATAIVVVSEIKGPVEAVDAGANRLTVLGQTVNADAATVFEDMPGGVSSLAAGDLVEVYAFFDRGTGSFTATRIERKTTLPSFKLRGVVAALDGTAKSFKIGDALISYGSAAELPTMLQSGMLVKVVLDPTQSNGAWVATKVETGDRHREHLDDDIGEAEISGLVSDFVSLADFKVNGVAVDASGANVVFQRGLASSVVGGAHIEVEGTVTDGVLVATQVKFEDGDGMGGDDHGMGGEREVELHGIVGSLDTTAQSFVLRGVTVRYGDATEFRDGLAADSLDGKNVEVKGQLTDGGTVVVAERIALEH